MKQTAQEWVKAYADRTPGLWGAHLVGSITTQSEDALYPTYKDVDLHLIFEPGHPALEQRGLYMNIIETKYQGLILEAGVKPSSSYQSVEAVVANPEIAHHLTVDSLLYDPQHCLADLQPGVRAEYPRRRWVEARMAHEARGLDQVDAVTQRMKSPENGGGWLSGAQEVQMLGYRYTFLTALLCIATLRAPTSGSRMLLHMREILADYGRLDLFDEVVNILGFSRLTEEQVNQFLREGAEAFDLAVRIRRTPISVQHKLNLHQRDHFVESCRVLIAEQKTLYAAAWLALFYLGATEVIRVDGNDQQKEMYSARQQRFLAALGLDTQAARDERFRRLTQLRKNLFELANEIVASNPAIHG